jgi:glycosyltransferase involved in cell wall biosynthesis
VNDRTLIIAHGHPDTCKGGAELVAYLQYRELRARGEDVVFLARDGTAAHGGTVFSSKDGERELLFHTAMGDAFNFRSAQGSHVWRDFRGLLKRFQPTVIHFHHYLHLGMELLRETRNTCPNAGIVLTLHEFLALCHHDGQMVKPGTLQLCYAPNPAACARCFPQYSPSDFFLRERYIKSLMADVDIFIAPSEFLAERYRKWGLPAERLFVLENGHPRAESVAGEPLPENLLRRRFAFFGQINPYKGLDLLLEAFMLLDQDVKEDVHLDIHGANLEIQTPEFRERLSGLSYGLGSSVTLHGPYEFQQLGKLMHQIGWVVVPSIWWENSPMVIQEAFVHARPVICADIGGMAEKVQDNVSGLHFRARSARSLASVIERAVQEPKLWGRLCSGIRLPPTVAEWTDQQIQLTNGLRSRPTVS